MAKHGFILQWQRYIRIIFTIICLTEIFLLLVTAQEKTEESKIAETTHNSTSNILTSITPTTETPTLEATTLISDEVKPKRVKPEQPLYFLAQYIQQFDDNVMLRENNRVGNLVSIPQIGFGLIHVRSRSLFRIDYLGGVEVHQHFAEFNGIRQSLNLAYEYDLTKRSMLFVNEIYFQSPLVTGIAAFTNPNLNSNALIPLIPTRLLTNDLTVGLVYQLSKFSDLRTSYSYSISRFNNPRLINFDEHKLELNYTKRLNRKYSYDILGRSSFFLDQSTQNNQTTHTLITSLAYRHKDKLSLRFGLGPQIFRSGSENDEQKFFLATLTQLNYQATKTTYTLSFTTGIGRGGGLATVTRNKALFGTIAHSFNRKLKAEIGLGYSNSSSSSTAALSPINFINNELIINNRLSYLTEHKVEVFFEYIHSKQKGTATIVRNVNRNIFSLGFRFDTRKKLPTIQTTSK